MFQYIVNIYFILIFYHGLMIYIYISKHFNFISAYNGFFSYYKCLSNNASKHLKMIHNRFLKYASKHK